MIGKHTMEIKVKDLDLGQICDSGQCFRMYRIGDESTHVTGLKNEYEITALNRYLRLGQEGSSLVLDCTESDYSTFWSGYFDMDTDYGRIKAMVDPKDAYLTAAAEYGHGIRILRQDLWEMIVTFLISQQNNIPRIHKCVDNICRTYGQPIETVSDAVKKEGRAIYSFPTAESLAALPEDALMECNLGYRSKYVVRTAREVLEGKYDLDAIKKMDPGEARNTLLEMYGVGKKVADCICLFALHHIDAFPIDTHIRQILDREYADGFPFERYSGYLGVIQQYMFFYDL